MSLVVEIGLCSALLSRTLAIPGPPGGVKLKMKITPRFVLQTRFITSNFGDSFRQTRLFPFGRIGFWGFCIFVDMIDRDDEIINNNHNGILERERERERKEILDPQRRLD